MKYPCNLIRDILPIYHDEVCSEESKTAVKEHLETCEDCKKYYENMCESDIVERFSFDDEMERKKADSIKELKKKMKKRDLLIIIGVVIGSLVVTTIMGLFVVLFMEKVYENAEVEVYANIEDYEKYMSGENAESEFQIKWGMDETIFPDEITDEMKVTDYKMVYYNPWDEQYLSYLVVDYEEQDYEEEVKRLKNYESTEYKGYYGVTGFDEQYTLLAMYADEYQGFVYALTDNEDTIIYAEIIFCNYFMDLDYTKYIPEKYLPVGFDATEDNAYRKKMLGE
ncbi:MAG: zf-HC2 domain-containing protein [Lachnospiraceae bacterium]|nr:zf-HC2 domain-containing protein [Lachnospiraceae bacterium]